MSKSNSEAKPRSAKPRSRRSPIPFGDPLTLFIQLQHRSAPPSGRPPRPGAMRFNGGEHLWLGSRGAKLACDLVKPTIGYVDATLFQSIQRQSSPATLSYGEIVALSGDFYEKAVDLFEERPSPVPWLYEGNDLSDLREVFKGELAWIDKHPPGQSYPEDNIRLAWNAKLYLELALRNVDHFGWHNLRKYVAAHGEALSLAVQAKGQEGETFNRALYFNGFADHFLTDGFAAGHIRVPRAQILAWGEPRKLSSKVTGALSKVLHDQDGHVDELHGSGPHVSGPTEGLPVRNSAGDEWHARCDGQLFLDPGAASSKGVQLAERAVAESVAELLVAWKTGKVPTDLYEATRLVPFPDPRAPTLIQKFPADVEQEKLDALFESMQWFLKLPFCGGVKRNHLRELLQALPELMARLRAFVAEDARDPEVKRRIAPEYVEGFRGIR